MKRMLTLLLTVAALLGEASSASGEDAAVARAKAELQRQLDKAGAEGAISVKGDRPVLRQGAPALRAAEGGDCLSVESLIRTQSALGADRAAALDRLRLNLLSEGSENRPEAELALARAYLVLGFAEEARAIAAARHGAEAGAIAGLALLAEGDHHRAALAVSQLKSCGALYVLIDEAAGVLNESGGRLSAPSLATLEALPITLRKPIAERLAIESLTIKDGTAARLAAVAGPNDATPRTDASALLEAATGAPNDQAATATLASLAASPGPFRQHAMRELSVRLDEGASPDVVAALEDSIADEGETAPASPSLSALNLSLADRRVQRRDFSGAARALGSAYRHKASRAAAGEKYRALVKTLVSSNDADNRLQALDILALAPEMSGESLDVAELHIAASGFADLGAAEALSRLLPHTKIEIADKAYFLARALMRAGRRAEARALAQPYAKDARFAALIACCTDEDGGAKPSSNRDLGRVLNQDAYSAFLWRHGDFGGLRALVTKSPIEASTAERIAFSHLISGTAPPPAVLTAVAGSDGLTTLFSPVPNPLSAKPGTLAQFAQALKGEIKFIRGASRNE